MSKLHTILGGGGIIGRTLAQKLQENGSQPRLVDRVDLAGQRAADLLDGNAAREAVQGSHVVYFAVGLPYDDAVWETQFPPIVANVIAGVREAGARLVFLDNVYAYGPVEGIQTEDTPLAAKTRKGAARRNLIEQLEASDVDWVIARAADFYGPGANTTSVLNSFVLANVKAGKPVAWLGTADAKHSFTYTRDIADAMVRLANESGVSHTSWHVPTAPALTIRELARIASRQRSKTEPEVQLLDLPTVLEYAKNDAILAATSEMFYQFDRDYVVSSARYEKRFSVQPTSYEDGIRAASDQLA